MNLFEHNKAERRKRILRNARKLIAKHGYEGLTMRELAKASKVSVPTIYNLIGGKQAIIEAGMEMTFVSVASSLAGVGEGNFIDRALAIYKAGNDDLISVPGYYREVMLLCLVGPECGDTRRDLEVRYVAMMTMNLQDAQNKGQLVDWIDVRALAEQLFADYCQSMLSWAMGELDDAGLRTGTVFGMCLLLLGVAKGPAKKQLEQRLRTMDPPQRVGVRSATAGAES